MERLQTILMNPEFWMSFAFVLVVAVAVRPLYRFVRRWGAKEALVVQKSLKEAKDVRKKAEALVAEYEAAVRQQADLRRGALSEADAEIAVFEQESAQQTDDKILHKKQEVALRLKTIEENGRQDVKKKMLERVLNRTEQKLSERREKGELTEDMDIAVDHICAALGREIPV